MAKLSDSTQDQLDTIEELKARLKNGRQKRSEAAEKFRQCAAQAAQDTPADSALFFKKNRPAVDPNLNGNRADPPCASVQQVAEHKKKLIEQRKKRKAGLTRLKKTTYLAVQEIRTARLDSAEVRARLSEGYIEEPDEIPGDGA